MKLTVFIEHYCFSNILVAKHISLLHHQKCVQSKLHTHNCLHHPSLQDLKSRSRVCTAKPACSLQESTTTTSSLATSISRRMLKANLVRLSISVDVSYLTKLRLPSHLPSSTLSSPHGFVSSHNSAATDFHDTFWDSHKAVQKLHPLAPIFVFVIFITTSFSELAFQLFEWGYTTFLMPLNQETFTQ